MSATSPGAGRRTGLGQAGSPAVAVTVLTLVVALAHLPSLPDSLEDIDSVNFALGVRDFDVSRHRPHPPGYPVYIALAKTAVAAGAIVEPDAVPVTAPSRSALEARALAGLSLVAGLVAIVLLYRLFSCFGVAAGNRTGRPWRELDPRALAATALTVACPLFWYMTVRPMSDLPGLAAALAALVCLGLAWWRQQPAPDGDRRLDAPHLAASGRMIVLGALLAAFSIGFRSQNAMLTVPILLAVLIDRIGRGVAGALIGGAVAFVVGGLLWGVPLLVASGGLGSYLAALGAQAGEDFAGVEMLYLNPAPRLIATALVRTFVYPWDSLVLGTVVVALAALGAIALLVRERRTLAIIAALALPYAIFHLLFHDLDFVRYALPLVPAVAFLAVCGLELALRTAALPVSGALALWAIAVATPVVYAYGAEASPVARVAAALRDAHAPPRDVSLAMHQTFQRPLEAEVIPLAHTLPSPPRREWLELVEYWREGNTAAVWFLADPRRTDLALIDPRARRERRDFAWHFQSLSQMGGMRPAAVEWYRLPAPGWFAEEGWSLTPETAGIARMMQRGPSVAPIVARIRRRPEPIDVLVGGRHLGAAQDLPVSFTMAIDGRTVAAWQASPGFFLEHFELPAGAVAGEGPFAKLEISAQGGAATAIEQFDVQSAGSVMWGYADGWHEAEYNPRIGLWRWTSERAALRIVNAAEPLRLRLQIESPLRYFDVAPTVKVSAGGRVLSEAVVAADTLLEVTVPPDALAASDGRVTIESTETFVPADRSSRVADQRRLALRVFGVDVVVPN